MVFGGVGQNHIPAPLLQILGGQRPSWPHGSYAYGLNKCYECNKQLDINMSPPVFVWKAYLTLANVNFDLDQCELCLWTLEPWPLGHMISIWFCGTQCSSVVHNVNIVAPVSPDRRTERKWCIRTQRGIAQVGSKMQASDPKQPSPQKKSL